MSSRGERSGAGRLLLGLALLGPIMSARASAQPGGDPAAEEPDDAALEEAAPDLHRHLALGGQWFFVQSKVMPGVIARGGSKWFWVHIETSLLSATEESPVLDGGMLGSQLGGHIAVSPLNVERAEIHLGVGGDFYWLWGIHGDEWQLALSTRASGHLWLTREIGAFASARAYPVSSSGLELGTTRDREQGLPVLLSIGAEWRPP